MLKHWMTRALLLGVLSAVSSPALAADPPPNEKPSAEKKARKGQKGKGKRGDARRKQRMEAQAKRLDERAQRLRAEGKADEAARMEARADKLRKGASAESKRRGKPKSAAEARRERKFTKLKALRKKYGKGLDNPGVRDELSLHAERSAKLRRMNQLAQESGKPELAERVSKLTQMEKQRHDAQMNKLLGGGDKAREAKTPTTEASQ